MNCTCTMNKEYRANRECFMNEDIKNFLPTGCKMRGIMINKVMIPLIWRMNEMSNSTCG